ncbi:MAG: hypothetical protein HY203_05195 [Nitrospirae bacterium]|nr:hypothetical protein [Nitrospirota bacterium]
MILERAKDSTRWYAVNTKPHQEEQVVWLLGRAGIEMFYPKLRESKRIRGSRKVATGPLFPGYLFARFSLESHYRTVQYARGVRRVVAFGPHPEPIDPEIIHSLRASVKEGFVTLPEPPLQPQGPVTIQEGPLKGLLAVFERPMSGGERVVLLLQALAYQARVVIEREKVVAVGAGVH